MKKKSNFRGHAPKGFEHPAVKLSRGTSLFDKDLHCIKQADWRTQKGFITEFLKYSPIILIVCTCLASFFISAAIMRRRSVK